MKTPPTYLRFMCFQKTSTLTFNERWAFSWACHVWFLEKRRVSQRQLRKHMSDDTAREALAVLVERGMIGDGRPVMNDELWKKQSFNPKKWWRGCQLRQVPFEDIASMGKRYAVLQAFKQYKNKAGDRVGPSFLNKATGISKRTIKRFAVDTVPYARKQDKQPLVEPKMTPKQIPTVLADTVSVETLVDMRPAEAKRPVPMLRHHDPRVNAVIDNMFATHVCPDRNLEIGMRLFAVRSFADFSRQYMAARKLCERERTNFRWRIFKNWLESRWPKLWNDCAQDAVLVAA